MKKKIFVILIIVCFALSLTSCYKAPQHDITVYKTSVGIKYHKEKCRYVKGKSIDIKLSKAIYDGLQPCKVCHPSTQKDLDTLNK